MVKLIQGTLFGPANESEKGYKGSVATRVAKITYRQLDHWDRAGHVSPSIKTAEGSGSRRYYSFKDIILLRTVKCLRDLGLEISTIRNAIDQLRSKSVDDLSEISLVSDGKKIYECTTNEQVFALIKVGYGSFISIAQIWKEIRDELDRVDADEIASRKKDADEYDELAVRRARSSER